MAPVRVMIAEDQPIVRAGFRALLKAESDFEVVGEAPDGRLAVHLARKVRPDVVLMDVRMPELDGIEATRLITSELPDTRVIVLTTFEHNEYVFGALRAGASGFLLKGGQPIDLLAAIRVVADGESLLAPSVTRRLIQEFVSRPSSPGAPPAGYDELTAREREVLRLIADGRNNHEIATDLHLSPLTAKTHVSRILGKLGARDRAQLVVIAYQTGLVRGDGAGQHPTKS